MDRFVSTLLRLFFLGLSYLVLVNTGRFAGHLWAFTMQTHLPYVLVQVTKYGRGYLSGVITLAAVAFLVLSFAPCSSWTLSLKAVAKPALIWIGGGLGIVAAFIFIGPESMETNERFGMAYQAVCICLAVAELLFVRHRLRQFSTDVAESTVGIRHTAT